MPPALDGCGERVAVLLVLALEEGGDVADRLLETLEFGARAGRRRMASCSRPSVPLRILRSPSEALYDCARASPICGLFRYAVVEVGASAPEDPIFGRCRRRPRHAQRSRRSAPPVALR
jgi:hypothetical protein